MSDKKYIVEIADSTGHSVVEMTAREIVEKTNEAAGSWVFVDNRLVETKEIENMEISTDSKIRIMPGIVGGVSNEEELYTVEVADKTGHSIIEMSKEQLVETANSGGTWLFVDDKMVSAAELKSMKIEQSSRLRAMPGLVGGISADEEKFIVEIADETGHSQVEMTKPELINRASNCEGTWVFVDNRMVATADLAKTDLLGAQKVRLMPGLVGGRC
ncbi:MAG: hypothetical protein DWB99_01580 [Candidatus Poseidoniales archaeon]|nr:MAG: hypothetical protein DWB99_01580 [Candidatus Poseidoniales archaeon]